MLPRIDVDVGVDVGVGVIRELVAALDDAPKDLFVAADPGTDDEECPLGAVFVEQVEHRAGVRLRRAVVKRQRDPSARGWPLSVPNEILGAGDGGPRSVHRLHEGLPAAGHTASDHAKGLHRGRA